MKRLLIGVAIVLFVGWVISWFHTPQAVATAAAKTWPGGLGPLESAAARFPPMPANVAAVKLKSLASALPQNDAISAYVAREVARDEPTIGASPALPDVTAIRELLLHESIVWERHEGFDHPQTAELRAMQLTIARTLIASALSKARADDPAAWDDLHAGWNLARTLDVHPQMMTQTAALATARMINAIAWKLPLPAPPWFAELQARDNIQSLLSAFQYQAASYWANGTQTFPTKWLADSVEHDRLIAHTVVAETRCDARIPMNDLGVDLSSVWHRAFRYRAEREATANALRIREGKPIATTSRCSDGSWSFDGATLRFSRAIATAPPDQPMPLVLRMKGEESK